MCLSFRCVSMWMCVWLIVSHLKIANEPVDPLSSHFLQFQNVLLREGSTHPPTLIHCASDFFVLWPYINSFSNVQQCSICFVNMPAHANHRDYLSVLRCNSKQNVCIGPVITSHWKCVAIIIMGCLYIMSFTRSKCFTVNGGTRLIYHKNAAST